MASLGAVTEASRPNFLPPALQEAEGFNKAVEHNALHAR